MRALTISELEQASDVPRSTIYYYVREGILPQAQKAAASRAIYTDAHVELLQEIHRLKTEGLALDEIRARLDRRIESAQASEVDLVAREAERTRRSILEAAARQFSRKGYKRTRIADIIKEAGISPPAFYGFFRTKRQLLIESFGVFVQWSRELLEPQLTSEPDLAVRLLRRTGAFYGVQALSPDRLALVRSEALIEDNEMRQVAQSTYQAMVQGMREDLVRLREGGAAPPGIPDELMAFSLEGALEHVVMRAAWDDDYTKRDVVMTHLCLYLAIVAVYTGRLDLTEQLARYADLIDTLVEFPPPETAPTGP